MTDTASQIKNKINKFAFSGGGDTLDLHKENGGDTSVDVAFQYLRFFLDDDEELADIKEKYESGVMMTSELKARCIEVVQELVGGVQQTRKGVTDEVVKQFMDVGLKKDFVIKK